jgi:SAM-dependent methyltransferase
MTEWAAACPSCRNDLGPLIGSELACTSCGGTFPNVDGVWRIVAPERQVVVDRFLHDYTKVRRAEGRGSLDAAYYLALPDPLPGDALGWQWSMRSITWQHVCRRLLSTYPPGLRVVDLGAGVGWLSNRLSEMGHDPVAIDLSVDDLDGLGATRHYQPDWPCVQAEFDRLPLASSQADLIIYNASFHYSTDYRATLTEARRVLRPGGAVIVLDTPVYRRSESGPRMVAERHRQFEEMFGTRSDSVASVEFLTDTMLADLHHTLGIRWRRSAAWYGWKWWLRPWKARLRRKREPSRFVTLLGDWPGSR